MQVPIKNFYKKSIWLLFIFIISIFVFKSFVQKPPIVVKAEVKENLEDLKEPIVQKISPPKKQLSVAQKKQRFKDLLVPAIDKAYTKLDKQYKEVKELIKTDPKNPKIEKLKKEYKAKTNQDLLYKLKPHPKSVTLAQAAIESAWGTSRFFYKANNVFGVWSFNKNEPRIAAGETRGEKTIYLKKYNTIEDSVLDYYKTLAKGKPYYKFRVQNYKDPNPYKLVTFLDSYSEKRDAYGKILISVIGHNKFTQYDEKFYPRPPKPKIKKEIKEKTIVNDDQKNKIIKNEDLNTTVQKTEEAQIPIQSNIKKENTKREAIDSNSTKEQSIEISTTKIAKKNDEINSTSK